MQKKKVAAKDKALEHFDDFYQTIYGESWPNIRAALLKDRNKHMAIVNNFGDTEKTIEKFELAGAINLKSIYDVQRANLPFRNVRAKKKQVNETKPEQLEIENVLADKQIEELRSVYPADYEPSQRSLGEAAEDEDSRQLAKPLEPVQMRPLEEDLAMAKPDITRIIKPSMGLTSSTLHEYIPATKIKGLDDWLLESDHYGYYEKGAGLKVKVEIDPILNIPEHLKVYTFEALNDSKFPSPKRGVVGVYDYYLMDGGSILPVLALDLQPGDNVLDMCAAPGGKTMAILQTLMPRVLVANDSSLSRMNKINDVIEEYFGDLGVWNDRLFITHRDARELEELDMYNKVRDW